ncbi:MAG: hypothetical protein H6518_03935 [Microthrixaceae bacterium]|nr:hypothetical protein [Microthrixaceae bacterium]
MRAGNYEGLLGPLVDAPSCTWPCSWWRRALALWRDGVLPCRRRPIALPSWITGELTTSLDDVLVGEALVTRAVAQITPLTGGRRLPASARRRLTRRGQHPRGPSR